MNYWLEFDEITVVPYLFNLDVSRSSCDAGTFSYTKLSDSVLLLRTGGLALA